MSLNDKRTQAIAAIKQRFISAMNDQIDLPEGLSEDQESAIRANFGNIGQALAEAVVVDYTAWLIANVEIGTITSSVVGSSATQSNGPKGLLS